MFVRIDSHAALLPCEVREIVGCSQLPAITAVVKPTERGRSQVPDQLAFGALHELLSPDEREYCSVPSEAHLQRDRLLARALVRTTLARYCSDGVR